MYIPLIHTQLHVLTTHMIDYFQVGSETEPFSGMDGRIKPESLSIGSTLRNLQQFSHLSEIVHR